MNIHMRVIAMLLSMLLVSACVSSPTNLEISSESARIDAYLAKGKKLEEQERFSQALEQYEKALSLEPDNKFAIQLKEQILFLLETRAFKNFDKGISPDEQRKNQSAKNEYLSALKDPPDHKKAKQKTDFKGQNVETRDYIFHTLKPGENISKLGLIYYGDLKAYPVIGEFNRLNDVTRVRTGQKLKIPVIEGIPLSSLQQAQEKYIKSRADKIRVESPQKEVKNKIKSEKLQKVPKQDHAEPDKGDFPSKKKGEENRVKKMQPSVSGQASLFPSEKLFALYDKGVKFFNNKQYEQAIPMFKEAEKGHPHNEFLRNYLFESYFQLGLIQFNLAQYPLAKKHFEFAFSYNVFCEKCADYIEYCELNGVK